MAKSKDRYDNLHLLKIQTIAVGMNMKSKKKACTKDVFLFICGQYSPSH